MSQATPGPASSSGVLPFPSERARPTNPGATQAGPPAPVVRLVEPDESEDSASWVWDRVSAVAERRPASTGVYEFVIRIKDTEGKKHVGQRIYMSVEDFNRRFQQSRNGKLTRKGELDYAKYRNAIAEAYKAQTLRASQTTPRRARRVG